MGKKRGWETGRLCLKAILENYGIKTRDVAVRAAGAGSAQ